MHVCHISMVSIFFASEDRVRSPDIRFTTFLAEREAEKGLPLI